MTHRKFIVEGEQLISSIKCALDENISNHIIVKELMENIENNVWTVLEDDCEEFIDDDWEYKGD